MASLFCGGSNRSTVVTSSLPSLPDFISEDSTAVLRTNLQEKMAELRQLEEQASQLESQRDFAILTHKQYAEVMEAQDAEMARLSEKLPGGASLEHWEAKHAEETAMRESVQAQKESLESESRSLREELGSLTELVDRQAAEIAALKEGMSEDEGEEDASASGRPAKISKRESPAQVVSRLQELAKGEMVLAVVKDKYRPTWVTLGNSFTELRLAASSKKKAFDVVALGDVASMVYPAPPSATSPKKGGVDKLRPFLSFAVVMEDGRLLSMLAPSYASLLKWFLGLQNLTAKPGQEIVASGEMLWRYTKEKIRFEAETRNITPHKMVAQAFSTMLAPDEMDELHSVQGSESSRVSSARGGRGGGGGAHTGEAAIAEEEEEEGAVNE